MKIVIDPGHGGHDSGAIGPTGAEEAFVNLDVSKIVFHQLGYYGLETKITRDADYYVALQERTDIANSWEADYFVSIHCNSDGPNAVGIETLYTSDIGHSFADIVQESMINVTQDVDRGVKERDDLHVLNATNMPAILVEIGFISHPETEQRLKTPDYRITCAEGIVGGIIEFLQLPPTNAPL